MTGTTGSRLLTLVQGAACLAAFLLISAGGQEADERIVQLALGGTLVVSFAAIVCVCR